MHLCLVNFITPPQIAEWSIVMTVSVCLSMSISFELRVQSLRNFLCLLPMAMARSSSGGVAIHYILPLPVVSMTSYWCISQCS